MIPDAPLETVDAVIDALGGTAAVARLVGRPAQAVSNWRKRGSMPAETFLVFDDALRARDLEAPSSLWGMVQAGEAAEART